ncbi:GGDEF domain-containing protein [Pseudonocardiaceae bacterium YIM PH 21723]|nr:GGDEF domain-containing protein [Pseudonocardiaceae bacterium YIM PH 21723]
MGGLDRTRFVGDCEHLEQLMRAGRIDQVGPGSVRLIQRAADPLESTQAHLYLLTGLFYDRLPLDQFTLAANRAHQALQRNPVPTFLAEFHAISSCVTALNGEVASAVEHIVHGVRAAEAETMPSVSTALAWADLGYAASIIGLVDKAAEFNHRSREEGARWGFGMVGTVPRLMAALVYDHRGDTPACIRELESLCALARSRTGDLFANLYYADRLCLAYAAVRLAALGGDPGIDAHHFWPAGPHRPHVADFELLFLACSAVAEGKGAEAITLLDAMMHAGPGNPVETLRLRSLALSSLGDHAAALAVEREAWRLAADMTRQCQNIVVQGVAANLDRAEMAEALAGYANAALTDPLTGLPNRRHLEERLAEMTTQCGNAVIGVLDLDRFKDINTVHGHLVGDQVLMRVAAALTTCFGPQDFLARYGGDEFVAILPTTSIDAAYGLGDRILATLRDVNWSDIAPGSQVGVSIGWAEFDGRCATTVLGAADKAMYRAKSSAGRN